MKKKVIKSLEEFINQVLSINSIAMLSDTGEMGKVIIAMNEDGSYKVNEKNEIQIMGLYADSLIFRGQNADYPLMPKLGRIKQDIYFEIKEKKLIEEIKRRGDKLVKNTEFNDWELLVYVQHYGLATRLLDWTTNPLTALWFACQDSDGKNNAYVYILKYNENNLIDTHESKSPYNIRKTKIFKPNLNNDRIIAQNGWFSVHSLKNEKKRFIPLENEEEFKEKIWMIEIPAENKEEILAKLNILGINQETIYPGIEGACKYVNWLNDI